jgi:hypothetical protein
MRDADDPFYLAFAPQPLGQSYDRSVLDFKKSESFVRVVQPGSIFSGHESG